MLPSTKMQTFDWRISVLALCNPYITMLLSYIKVCGVFMYFASVSSPSNTRPEKPTIRPCASMTGKVIRDRKRSYMPPPVCLGIANPAADISVSWYPHDLRYVFRAFQSLGAKPTRKSDIVSWLRPRSNRYFRARWPMLDSWSCFSKNFDEARSEEHTSEL